MWYDDFHHDNIAFDDVSPLATELKQFLMSFFIMLQHDNMAFEDASP
jgi:hypothetical protein